MNTFNLQQLLSRVIGWAEQQDHVRGVALVGSWARGTARPDSDVDLVILLDDPRPLLEDVAWVGQFGTVTGLGREDWGMVQSLRVQYAGGPEVEFGVTSAGWATPSPLDEGTRAVASHGLRIIFDPYGLLARLMKAAAP